jgi:hypothetical protein
MKKELMIFFGILLLTIILSAFVSSQTCTDSDNGLNYEEQGVVNGLEVEGIFSNFTDYCGFSGEEENKLVEYTCESNNYVKKNLYLCPIVCVEGKCTNKELKSEETTQMQVAYCKGYLSCDIFTSKLSCESASERMKKVIKDHPEITFTSNLFCEWNEESSSCEKEISCAFLYEEECKSESASTCSWEVYSSWERFINWFKSIFNSKIILS